MSDKIYAVQTELGTNWELYGIFEEFTDAWACLKNVSVNNPAWVFITVHEKDEYPGIKTNGPH